MGFGSGGNGQTGMDGEFNLTHVRPGSYYISVQMPGYVDPINTVDHHDLDNSSDEAQARVQQKLQMIQVGSDSTSIDLTLERGGALSGVVRYEDGSPASNVRVLPMMFRDGKHVTIPFTGSLNATDDRGQFRITGLPPGTYYVDADITLPSTRLMRNNDPEIARSSRRLFNVFAPGTFSRSKATPFEVGYGSERNDVEITLNLSGLHTVGGHVAISETNKKRQYVSLREAGVEDGFSRSAQADSNGSFTLEDVPDGTYCLIITGSRTPVAMVTVHGADVTDLNLAPASQQSAQ
ncbi:MAG: hypothetical protein JSS87_08505 [Acidobacteria bacterium]|nr:hypothetical protein [Acidobacteriota bacterium]